MFQFLRSRSKPTTPETGVQSVAQNAEQRSGPVDPWWDWAAGCISSGCIAGPEVSPLTALSCPPVLAAVNLISGICGSLPVNLFRPAGQGGKEIATDHPAQSVANTDSNPWTSAGELRSTLTADALLWGSGYALVIRDQDGNPQELHRLLPTAVIARIDPATSEPTYEYGLGTAGGATFAQRYSWRDIIVIRPTVQMTTIGAFGFVNGLAPIKAASTAIGLSLALQDHAARLMAQGGRPSGVLSFAGKLGNEVVKRIGASWHEGMAGRASGRTAVLEEGGKFTPLAFTSVDAQFQEMRDFQILEVSRAFGVPPPFLGEHGRATWANYEQSSRQLTQFCLQPWFESWEAAFRRVLLTDQDRADGLYFSFDLDQLLQGDLLARASAYSTLITSRVINPNEAREREHMPSYQGGDAFQNPNTAASPIPTAPAGKNGGMGG